MPPPPTNPFRIHGVVAGEFFTDRAAEVDRIRATLREPGAKLLVYGPRRVGKTSAIARAVERQRAAGGVAFLADLSTGTTIADAANRILEAAGAALARKWKDVLVDLVKRIGASVTLAPDPATGLIVPSLNVSLRSATIEVQRASLARALDTLESLARERRTTIGIVLDEFQEIRRFGGDEAEWHLRGVIQRHAHISYVFAGSESHVIGRMLDKGGAFYKLADQLVFGPIDAGHLARWIDDRLAGAGVKPAGVGAAVVSLAGPRTRDIVQVARQCYDNCTRAKRATADDVAKAVDDVVDQQAAPFESMWGRFSAVQQNVLRAVAARVERLTTVDATRRFGFTSSGVAANAAKALVDSGTLVKAERRGAYGFDSPFLRRWVETRALPDIPGFAPGYGPPAGAG